MWPILSYEQKGKGRANHSTLHDVYLTAQTLNANIRAMGDALNDVTVGFCFASFSHKNFIYHTNVDIYASLSACKCFFNNNNNNK